MNLIRDLFLFIFGLVSTIAFVVLSQLAGGVWSFVQIPVVILVVVIFFFKESRLAALAAGLGLGLDFVSSYPFLTWTVIVGATAFFGWWISKTVLTNRSWPSLLILGAIMRALYFILELIVSRAAELFGGTVWYKVTQIDVSRAFAAFGVEVVLLSMVFIVYVRSRGERSRMLTHVQ